MRIALDTNVLAYAAGVDRSPEDSGKIRASRDIIRSLAAAATLVAPAQAIGELFVVLQRAGSSREAARAIALEFRESMAGADSLGTRSPLRWISLSITSSSSGTPLSFRPLSRRVARCC